MNMLYIGELAAIITSITYAVNSTLFTVAGRAVGSTVVNRVRLFAACLFLTLAHWIFLGSLWPVGAEWNRWFWLGLSGIIGLVLGDAFLFQAFVLVGPRLSMLMMSLAPIIAAITAWVFLGETLTFWQMGGIVITLIGVGWVVLDKNNNQTTRTRKRIILKVYFLVWVVRRGRDWEWFWPRWGLVAIFRRSLPILFGW